MGWVRGYTFLLLHSFPPPTHTHTQFEYSVMDRVCKGALESYNMSFRDCLEVVHAKADFIDTITRQLGGSVD